MYRYRENTGSTRHALQAAERHLAKVGNVHTIRAYLYQATYKWGTRLNHAIMVKGDKGSARFQGFCFGYFGTGPHGLVEMLATLAVPHALAELLAFHSLNGDTAGNAWELTIHTDKTYSVKHLKCREQQTTIQRKCA